MFLSTSYLVEEISNNNKKEVYVVIFLAKFPGHACIASILQANACRTHTWTRLEQHMNVDAHCKTNVKSVQKMRFFVTHWSGTIRMAMHVKLSGGLGFNSLSRHTASKSRTHTWIRLEQNEL